MSRTVASGLGLGHLSRRAPGTVGSLAAAVAGAGVPRGRLALLAALAGVCGWFAVRGVPEGEADPSWIVVDEIAGQWIALLAVPPGSAVGTAAAFGLFRALDILKPGPVGWAERRGGAAGVMLDDVVAGAIAAAVIAVVRQAAPRWRKRRW